MDAQTHEILDILPNRQLHALRSYFSQFPLSVRKQVQSIVIDMNAPYFIVIKELFPNAKTIIDRFHIVQQMNRSLNQNRIRIMKKFNHSAETLLNTLPQQISNEMKTSVKTLKKHKNHIANTFQ